MALVPAYDPSPIRENFRSFSSALDSLGRASLDNLTRTNDQRSRPYWSEHVKTSYADSSNYYETERYMDSLGRSDSSSRGQPPKDWGVRWAGPRSSMLSDSRYPENDLALNPNPSFSYHRGYTRTPHGVIGANSPRVAYTPKYYVPRPRRC